MLEEMRSPIDVLGYGHYLQGNQNVIQPRTLGQQSLLVAWLCSLSQSGNPETVDTTLVYTYHSAVFRAPVLF